jgi:hypothetical protein
MSKITNSAQLFAQITRSSLSINPSRFILQVEREVYTRRETILRVGSINTFAALDYASKIKWNRLDRASVHGCTAADFHRLCDNKGPTVVLIRAENGRVAAGYSYVSWTSGHAGYDSNPSGFRCAIDTNENSFRLCKGLSSHSSLYHTSFDPFFSDGIVIWDQCNQNYTSSSTLGKAFKVMEIVLFCTYLKSSTLLSMKFLVIKKN